MRQLFKRTFVLLPLLALLAAPAQSLRADWADAWGAQSERLDTIGRAWSE